MESKMTIKLFGWNESEQKMRGKKDLFQNYINIYAKA